MTDRAMNEALRLAEIPSDYSSFTIKETQEAQADLRRLHAENEALRAEVGRLRLMQPVTIGPTGQSNILTAGEIAAIDAARKEST